MNKRTEMIANIEAEYETLTPEEKLKVKAKIAELKASRQVANKTA